MATIAAERLSTLLDRIYDCATNPGLWSATLVGINQVTACTQAVLGLVSFPENRTLMQAHTGIDEQFEGRLRDSMGQLEHIWGGAQAIAEFPIDAPIILSKYRPSALVRGNTDHDLLCRVAGFDVADTLNLPLTHIGSAVGTALFVRDNTAGKFDAQHGSFFRMLSPHIRRSTEINSLLEASTVRLSALDSLFDRLNAPVLIADRNGRLLHFNSAAEALLSSGLISIQGQSRSIRSIALARAINSVGFGLRTTPHELVIDRASADGRAWTFHVIGLRDEDNAARTGFVAIVGAPDRTPTAEWLRVIGRTWDLTGSETGVLAHLLQGNSTEQIAGHLEVEPSTVRTHLLHIFDKLDVHGRAELVAKVHAMLPPFTPEQ